MDNSQKLRVKSAMIVYELENSLGNYVLENELIENVNEEGITSIADREKKKGREVDTSSVSFLVESSYLDEVFNLAINTAKGTAHHKKLLKLKNLCLYLGIFDIRNAISHPNRSFPNSYWFRSATIASDPLIDMLGLGNVRQALNAAIEGNLNAPPDEWFDNVKWAVPNTLPFSFDHEITGLLGRDKEFKDLHSTFARARNNLIAVVAPGGIGKTALILQFLKELSLSPAHSANVSAIVFCTLKNERLTANGIEQIEAINGIDQIKQSILTDLNSLYGQGTFSTFNEACDSLKNDKILICIDNLETLLMHSQKEFLEFNQSLPLLWRLIVTSRISIDSATTVPLEPLVKRHAINLSRNYLRKRGVQNIEQSILEKIAETAGNNPLAIRLTIDLYVKGADISQSIKKSQRDIAQFSYKNLIESLSSSSVSILEAIYVLDSSTKSELIEFLELTNEEIAEATNELAKTSLIIRTTDEIGIDYYKLSDSIRDLLLINPKNIEVRTKISENLKRTKDKILDQTKRNKQLGLTQFDENYVDSNTNRPIHALIVDLNKYLSKPTQKRTHAELVEMKSRFGDLLLYNQKDYQLNYHYSRVLSVLKDGTGELMHLLKAQKLNPESPRTTIAIAKTHFYNGDYRHSEEVFRRLLKKGFGDPSESSSKFAFTLTKLHLLCLLYQSKYEEILHITEDWRNNPNWSSLYGTYRASTYKRQSESTRKDVKKTAELLTKSLQVFDEIFSQGDYPIIACIESNKVIKEFDFVLHNKSYTSENRQYYVSFVAKHYFNILSRLRNESIESKESQEFLNKIYNTEMDHNPLHNVGWFSVDTNILYDHEHIEELVSDGFKIVEVYNIPDKGNGLSNFIFARDQSDRQFFLLVANYEGGWNGWGRIEIGTKLAIKHEKMVSSTKATPATEIVDIDQYIA